MGTRVASLRDLVKLKKFQKSEKNWDCPDHTRRTILLIFFWKQTTQKTQYFQKKRNPSWGLTHPPTSEFFSDFWIFLTRQNPYNGTDTKSERITATRLQPQRGSCTKNITSRCVSLRLTLISHFIPNKIYFSIEYKVSVHF